MRQGQVLVKVLSARPDISGGLLGQVRDARQWN